MEHKPSKEQAVDSKKKYLVITGYNRYNKPKDFLLIRKFVRRMKGGKRKTVNGQNLEKAGNLRP